MYIDTSDRVGIGTNNPEVALHVQTSDQIKFLVSEGNADQVRILRTGTSAGIVDVYDDDGSGQLDIYSVFMGAERKVSGTGEIAFIKVKVTGYGDAFLEVSDESRFF